MQLLKIDKDNYRLIDRFEFINLTLNKVNLVQLETSKYDEIFKQKKIYIFNIEYIPQNLLTQIKLYQFAIKRLYDNNQRVDEEIQYVIVSKKIENE